MSHTPGALRFTLAYAMMWLVGLALALVLCLLVLGGQFWLLSVAGDAYKNHPLHDYVWTPLLGFLLLPACFTAMIQAARRRTSGWILTSLPSSLPFVFMVGFFALEITGNSAAFFPSPYLVTPLNALAYFAIGHLMGVVVTYLKALLCPRTP